MALENQIKSKLGVSPSNLILNSVKELSKRLKKRSSTNIIKSRINFFAK